MLQAHRGVGQLVGVHLAEALVALRLLERLALLGELCELPAVLRVVVRVDVLLLALARADQLEPVQRRDGGVDPASLDQWAHVLEEQRRQQRTDVCAVGVGVRHEDHLGVPGRVEVERAP